MRVIQQTYSVMYISEGGDWALEVTPEGYKILPQVGHLEYQSAVNIENLAILILQAKQHAQANNINWQ